MVVVAVEEYRRLRGTQPDFKAFLRRAPDVAWLELVRPSNSARVVHL